VEPQAIPEPKTQPILVAAASAIVIIPAYNEARFIGSVVLGAKRYASAVIVVDDGSADMTADIAEAAGAMVLRHPVNQGKAAALNTGFRYAKGCLSEDESIQVVVILDGDGQHLCSDIPILANPILSGKADIAVGSRFLEVKSRIPKWRVFGQQVLTMATNVSSGVNLTDSQSGFRAFSRQVLDQMDFESDGFSVESEMQFIAQEQKFQMIEVPIHVIYAEPPKRNPVAQGLKVIDGIAKLMGQYRPLIFFTIPGASLILIGMGWGIVVIDRFQVTGHLAVGYAMICVLLSIIGMILISTGFTLHSIRGLLIDLLQLKGKKASG